jgi:glycosyltransferase involved in cell wall biosynthesis
VKFHAIMIIRDEADVVCECLTHLLTWCDSLSIYDTGSTDGTWDLIHEAARRDRRINPVASEPVIAEGDTRGYLFSRVRDRFRSGDWIARVDADEFYHAPPREWLVSNVAAHEARVFAQMYEFVLTKADYTAFEAGLPCPPNDTTRPVQERVTKYIIQSDVEPRFFRFRRGMQWGPGQPGPWNPGLPAARRIPVRHYRWRSFEQLRRRCALRQAMAEISYHGSHWAIPWRDWLVDDADPWLKSWKPGEVLPTWNDTNHLPTGVRKFAQDALYRTGLVSAMDAFRREWPRGRKPRPLPEGFQSRVQQDPPPSTRKNASMS